MTEFLKSLLTAGGAAGLGPGPRPGVLTESAVRRAVSSLPTPAGRAPLLLALVLLWHDHHDAAHAMVQDLENADGSYIHAILHRREPDYWNAKYWFRRVGQHPAYATLAHRVEAFGGLPDFSEPAQPLIRRCLTGGRWDAMAFVDACEEALAEPTEPAALVLREIQRLEFEVLAEYLAGR